MEKKFSVKQKQIMKFKSLIQKFKNLLNVIGVNIAQIIKHFLDSLELLSPTTEQKHFCETKPWDKEILGTLKCMPNNKIPMSDK